MLLSFKRGIGSYSKGFLGLLHLLKVDDSIYHSAEIGVKIIIHGTTWPDSLSTGRYTVHIYRTGEEIKLLVSVL